MEEPQIPPWCEECDAHVCSAGTACAVDLFKTAAIRLSDWKYDQGYMLEVFDSYRRDEGDKAAEKCFRMSLEDANKLRVMLETMEQEFPIFSIISRELDNLGNILISGRHKNSPEISSELNNFLITLFRCRDERQDNTDSGGHAEHCARTP